eukprot:m.96531 g.96531  ORF g.96531 m.96531 type:complete len:161 (-) comp15055_c0_seq1:411-893(-)
MTRLLITSTTLKLKPGWGDVLQAELIHLDSQLRISNDLKVVLVLTNLGIKAIRYPNGWQDWGSDDFSLLSCESSQINLSINLSATGQSAFVKQWGASDYVHLTFDFDTNSVYAAPILAAAHRRAISRTGLGQLQQFAEQVLWLTSLSLAWIYILVAFHLP